VDRAALQGLSKLVIDAAFAVHTQLGPGLLESSYTACMKSKLEKQGLRIEAEVPVPLVYDGQKRNDFGYGMDLLGCGELSSRLRRWKRSWRYTTRNSCPT
jgi:GxxExxY protein